MKEKIIRLLSEIGKRNKRLVRPVMAVMIVFLTFYHAIKKFLFDVRYHKIRMRTLTVAVSLAVVFTLIVLPSLAEEGDDVNEVVYVEQGVGELSAGGSLEQSMEEQEKALQEKNESMAEPTPEVVLEEKKEADETVLDETDFLGGQIGEETDSDTNETTYIQGESKEKKKIEKSVKTYESGGETEELTVSKPDLTADQSNLSATYGKINEAVTRKVEITATAKDAEGETSFQYIWKLQGETGEPVPAPGVNNKAVYTLPDDIDAGSYLLSCDVTTTRELGGKTATRTDSVSGIDVMIYRAPLQQTLQDSPADVLSYDLSDVYYDGKKHGVGASKKATYESIGELTVKYEKEGGAVSAEEPKETGTYTVTVSVSQGKNYEATTSDVTLGQFVIRYWEPEGSYTVDGDVSGTDGGGEDWYKETVKIVPPSGCKISGTESSFQDELTLPEGKNTIDYVYFQKVPEGYISKKIEVNDKYYVDLTKPELDISFTTDSIGELLYRLTGSGNAFSETQKVTVAATDGGSGVKEIYYYATNEGPVDYRGLSDGDWTVYSEFKITETEAESTNYYVYAKAVDYAGNVGYASNEDIVIDSTEPVFSVDGNVISSEKRFVADQKTLKVTDVNLEAVTIKRAEEAEAEIGNATEVVISPEILEKDGKREFLLNLPSPDGTGGVYKYFVTAADASGNKSQAVVIMVDPVSDVTVEELVFPEETYGYIDDSVVPQGFVCTKAPGYTEPGEPNITSVEILSVEETDQDAFTVVDGTKIKPVNRLHAGEYMAKVRIHYNSDSTIVSTCRFVVKKAMLNAEYRGQDVWYHTINPDFSNYIYISGFQYGETPGSPDNAPYLYTAPVITNFTGPAVEIGVHKMTLGGGAAADYEFSYTDGFMKVSRRSSDRFSVYGTRGNLLEGEEDAYWYTDSEMTILPDDGFMLSENDSDMASFSESGFAITADAAKESITFYVMNISTGEISDPVTVTYGKDATGPVGSIKMEQSSIRDFFHTVTFGKLFTDTVNVTIEAEDDISGITSVQYAVSNSEWDESAIRAYRDWEEGDNFHISPEQQEKAYVYAKLVNGAGIVTYLAGDTVVFDTQKPQIAGVAQGASYVAEKKQITVTDDHLVSVTLYEGEDASGAGKAQLVDGANGTCVFDVTAAEGTKSYTIVAKDAADNEATLTFSMTKPEYEVSMADKDMGKVIYGYEKAPSSMIDIVNTGNAAIEISDVNIGNDKEFTLENKGGNAYEISLAKGLGAGQYTTKITVYYSGNQKVTAEYSATVEKAELTAVYKGQNVLYNETPDLTGTIEVTGFVNGETPSTAAGYETPSIEFTGTARETQVLVPKGGRADNYSFTYVKGVLQVVRNVAAEGANGQYTVSGTKTETGWYSSDITITPNNGYEICEKENSEESLDRIVLTEDTDSGRKEFYIRNRSTGELFKKTVFVYMRDVVTPVIAGVDNGTTYTGDEKKVTVTDAYLASVTVNGTAQPIDHGSAEFTLSAKEASTVYVIVARDRAGNTTDKTVICNKDGSISSQDGADLESDSAGEIGKKSVIVAGAPTASLTSSASDLAKAALNSEELTKVANGRNADIVLKVRNIDAEVSQSEKELIIANLNGYTLGQYLDLSLFKSVDGGTEKQVSNLNKNISVTVNIPEKLLNTDSSKTRMFAMIVVHNGKATLLKDQDSVANTITVFTKQFSTYALVYKDVKASDANESGSEAGKSDQAAGNRSSGASADSPATGDTAPVRTMILVSGVSFVGILAILIAKWKKRRKETV